MSNNAAGRAIRPIAPCGKIHFAGSGARGPRAATISILVESAKLNRKSLNLNFPSLSREIATHNSSLGGEFDNIDPLADHARR